MIFILLYNYSFTKIFLPLAKPQCVSLEDSALYKSSAKFNLHLVLALSCVIQPHHSSEELHLPVVQRLNV